MKRTGAWLARYAMEQVGIQYTLGIPGVHNTELYDELNKSEQIEPILVSHEGGGAFMADAISRVSDTTGTLVIVPAAGVAYAAAGIGEAFLDGIPMLVFCGGVRTDLEFENQLHEMDQHSFIKAFCKSTYLLNKHEDIIPTIYEAYELAHSGEPGPVFIEIPVNIQLFKGNVARTPIYSSKIKTPTLDSSLLNKAAELINQSNKPCIFAGWGAKEASDELIKLSGKLQAPVTTTLQGLSVFPHDNPLHAGFGFGNSAVPSAQMAFKDCDCLIAIGTKFSEIATGSFGIDIPKNIIHIDINPDSIGVNYPANVGIVADSKEALKALLPKIENKKNTNLVSKIAKNKKEYLESWLAHDSKDKINPAAFFQELRTQLPRDGITVVDDGNHTFLSAELMPIYESKSYISPTDFNCMGYSVPAAIGAKLSNRDKDVVTIVGDGCFTMTCMEISTATALGLGVVYFVFNDGELSQISQAQEIPYNRKPCTTLGRVNFEGVAMAVGADYIKLTANSDIQSTISSALNKSRKGVPIIVDVAIDYSKKTAFTLGAVKTNFGRFDLKTKLRFGGRALKRKITG